MTAVEGQGTAASSGGEAQELPRGRLRRFEDDDAPPDLASLLTRRAAKANGSSTAAPEPPPVPEPAVSSRPHRSTGPAAPPPPRATRRSHPRTAAAAVATADEAEPEGAKRQNRIRSSSVHIPAALIDRIIAERESSGRSNGEIVIAALEHTHSRLGELITRRGPAGGQGLFAARPSRGARLSDGPLTPLNVRLFEADYAVIDTLVEQFGAFSRGHLITAALTAYLGGTSTTSPSQPQKR